MAFAFVDYNYIENTTSGLSSYNFTMGKTIPSGATIVGHVNYQSGTSQVTSIVDNQSNTYAIKSHVFDSQGSGSDTFSFIRGNITNSPTTFTVNLDTNLTIFTQGISVIFVIYTGALAAADPTDGASQNVFSMQFETSNGSLTTFTAPAITPVTNGCLILSWTFADWAALHENWQTGVVSPGSGFTSRVNDKTHNMQFAWQDQTQATAGAITPTFTISPAYQNFGLEVTGAIAIKPGAGGGGSGSRKGALLMGLGATLGWTPSLLGAAAAVKAGRALYRNSSMTRRSLLVGGGRNRWPKPD